MLDAPLVDAEASSPPITIGCFASDNFFAKYSILSLLTPVISETLSGEYFFKSLTLIFLVYSLLIIFFEINKYAIDEAINPWVPGLQYIH